MGTGRRKLSGVSTRRPGIIFRSSGDPVLTCGSSGTSATRVTRAERAATTIGKQWNRLTAGAACAATGLVRTAVMIAMASKSNTDTVKQKRRRVARTLLAGSAQTAHRAADKAIPAYRRRYLVDEAYLNELPFNANGITDTAGVFHPYHGLHLSSNQYGNPYTPTSREPVVVAETVHPEPARLTWCEWIFSCRCERW